MKREYFGRTNRELTKIEISNPQAQSEFVSALTIGESESIDGGCDILPGVIVGWKYITVNGEHYQIYIAPRSQK